MQTVTKMVSSDWLII